MMSRSESLERRTAAADCGVTAEIAERLGFELIGHKLELYGVPIDGAEPSKREGLIFKRHAARVAPEDVDAG